MHFQWTITLGEVITFASVIAAISYKAGFTERAIQSLFGALAAFRSDFSEHEHQDVERFDTVNRNLVQISTSINK